MKKIVCLLGVTFLVWCTFISSANSETHKDKLVKIEAVAKLKDTDQKTHLAIALNIPASNVKDLLSFVSDKNIGTQISKLFRELINLFQVRISIGGKGGDWRACSLLDIQCILNAIRLEDMFERCEPGMLCSFSNNKQKNTTYMGIGPISDDNANSSINYKDNDKENSTPLILTLTPKIDKKKVMMVDYGKAFSIKNVKTYYDGGYVPTVVYFPDIVKLISEETKCNKPETSLIGNSGDCTFTFKLLKPVDTKIYITHMRPNILDLGYTTEYEIKIKNNVGLVK